jgi:hypothetical protein
MNWPALQTTHWRTRRLDLNEIQDRMDHRSLGIVLGRFAGDGTAGTNQLRWWFSEEERDIIPLMENWLREIGPIRPTTPAVLRAGRTVQLYSIDLNSQTLQYQMYEAGIKSDVPRPILESEEMTLGYLQGLFDADGNWQKETVALGFGASVPPVWPENVVRLLDYFGIASHLSYKASGEYAIRVHRSSVPTFLNRVNFLSSKKRRDAGDMRPAKY